MRVMRGPIGQRVLPGFDDMGGRIKIGVAAPQLDHIGQTISDIGHPSDQMRVL